MKKMDLCKDSNILSMLNRELQGDNVSECLTCGMCNSRCSWFEGDEGPIPREIVRMAVLGLDDLLAKKGRIWDCMLCNRCTVGCPMGIVMDRVVRKARALASARGIIPKDIQAGIKTRLETGDVNGFTREDFFETIEWMNEEFKEEVNDPDAVIPHDRKGARYLYLPNPREMNLMLMHLMATFKLFYYLKTSWTVSSRHTDVTNWGYFLGDDQVAKEMALQVVEAAEDLDIETLVLSECGHGYFVLKEMAEKLIGRKPRFEVIAIPELTLRMVEEGVIRLDPGTHPYPIAYHDPCNLGRKSGIYDVPRKLLAQCCEAVVELEPNRQNSICCGGGGGLIQDSTATLRRMVSGKAKAEQIRAAGVSHLATACLSCHRQLTELSKKYNLGVKVDTVNSLAIEALSVG